MSVGVEPVTIILYLIGFAMIFILCRVFIKPIKWTIRLLLSCAIGSVVMFVSNRLLLSLGIGFCINPLTTMISGVLGLPGMIMTLVLSAIL